ncbi:TRAP transporter substrate-binding protein [Paraglaciecola polaris]|uniref:TRAP dicarboxylate transporter subunit DctP n=1 Tax=Paraglaciecola polaris LMG 21857 TaxID=1129793 RepID=K7A857_9ALTE|nr:TRAP transporter substrate-binding protein DctP [Paraglaciecola polaris]GAC31630.1 TRAP dicarboxylate transporter subunit DctP [Paraglaciecola polaris LMG 21857]|tara:strand:- start:4752 stop:5792 length:1041 start_codon:yes stop_codon:yes gene_type:complete
MNTKRIVLLAVYACIAVASVVGMVNSNSDRAEFIIKASIQASTQDEDYVGLLAFKEYVEQASKGRVQVQLYSSGQFCGGVPECIGNLQKGVLEMFPTTAGGTGNFFAPAQVLDLPYVFDNDKQAQCVLDGPILGKMRETVLAQNLQIRLMGVTNTGGWRNFATTRKPIHHPRDLVGQKIRTTPAKIQQELVRQLGANPTPVSWAELYTALATGVVEGSKNGIQDIIGAKLEEHLKYIVLDGHSYMAALWWFSEPVWQSLPADIQEIIEQGFVLQQKAANDLVFNQEANSYTLFEKAGGTVYRPTADEKQAFKDASKDMRQWFEDNYGNDWLQLLESSVAQCSRQSG